MSSFGQKNKDNIDHLPVSEQSEHNSSFTGVPDDVIRTVASYLEEAEYVFFSITNKHHLSVCRSPNIVQTLSFAENDNLKDYPRVRSLYIELNEFVDSDNTFDSITRCCPQLNALFISAVKGGQGDFDKFLIKENDECGATNNIVFLRLELFTTPSISPTQLYWLLSRLPALTKLDMIGIEFSDMLDSNVLRCLCRNLRQLLLHDVDQSADIVDAFQSRLDSLGLDYYTLELSDYDWKKLRRFRLETHGSDDDSDELARFLMKAKHLREIAWSSRYCASVSDEDSFTELFSQHPKIEFFCFEVGSLSLERLNRMCHNINRRLWITRNLKRDVLEIAFEFLVIREEKDGEEVMFNLSNLILALSGTKTKRWMISVKFERLSNEMMEKNQNIVTGFMESCKESDIQLLLMTRNTLVFGNGGDAVLNEHERWWE